MTFPSGATVLVLFWESERAWQQSVVQLWAGCWAGKAVLLCWVAARCLWLGAALLPCHAKGAQPCPQPGRHRASRSCWPCAPTQPQLPLLLQGCQAARRWWESWAKPCAHAGPGDALIRKLGYLHVAFPNGMLAVTEKTEDEWCKISVLCSRLLIPSNLGPQALDSLPTPALLLAPQCSAALREVWGSWAACIELLIFWSELVLLLQPHPSDSLW